jgi:hypothetical protein
MPVVRQPALALPPSATARLFDSLRPAPTPPAPGELRHERRAHAAGERHRPSSASTRSPPLRSFEPFSVFSTLARARVRTEPLWPGWLPELPSCGRRLGHAVLDGAPRVRLRSPPALVPRERSGPRTARWPPRPTSGPSASAGARAHAAGPRSGPVPSVTSRASCVGTA